VLVAIRQTSKSALADTRLTLGALRGREDDAEGSNSALAGLDRLDTLVTAARAAGTPVAIRVEGNRLALPPGVDHAAYRIVQESLTNVLKHAGRDARASVLLRYAPDALTIQVTDDGSGRGPATGQDALPSGGNGLVGMAERAASVGGEVTAGPREDGGFEVIAHLPLNAGQPLPPDRPPPPDKAAPAG
jgi:signal transduction histidine kinase